jgi:hypothetical protein
MVEQVKLLYNASAKEGGGAANDLQVHQRFLDSPATQELVFGRPSQKLPIQLVASGRCQTSDRPGQLLIVVHFPHVMQQQLRQFGTEHFLTQFRPGVAAKAEWDKLLASLSEGQQAAVSTGTKTADEGYEEYCQPRVLITAKRGTAIVSVCPKVRPIGWLQCLHGCCFFRNQRGMFAYTCLLVG